MPDPIIPTELAPSATPELAPSATPEQATLPQPPAPQPINGQPSGLTAKKSYKKIIRWSLIGFGGLIIAVAASMWGWYVIQLSPASSDTQKRVLITIEPGTGPAQISSELEEKQVIRSSTAFDIHTRLSGTRDSLQAGTYRLAPSDNVETIVGHLTSGVVDTFNLTLFPGATLVDATDRPADQKLDVTSVLLSAGYEQSEISAAFAKTYDHPVFAGKPETADIEGYVYGETYNFNSGASVEDILIRAFDELYRVVQDNDLVAKYQAQGLSLYEGITLASIVQREVATESDRKQVAQVFFSRLEVGMMLGSDVTYQYIADKTGVDRDVNLDSPYNTRRYAGLPPGPIASPGLTSLLAVAAPASGDYIYFLSGDDDITYFARTNAEHEANILNHCAVKCSVL